MGVFICHYPSALLYLKSILCTSHKEKAQTFAIRRTVHHKPHRNMGNLRPKRGSSYILCLLVASTVVIVRLPSLCLAKIACRHYALQR